jgi:hypothetical protein
MQSKVNTENSILGFQGYDIIADRKDNFATPTRQMWLLYLSKN